MVGGSGVTTASGRFSPARAGNGGSEIVDPGIDPVQPRACGEWGGEDIVGDDDVGSAPRVRGMGRNASSTRRLGRFSPARAGNGVRAKNSFISCAVQPRACGEWSLSSAQTRRTFGSAPRVRGMVSREVTAMEKRRFSPARAGNGSCRSRSCSTSPVQPRACGEWSELDTLPSRITGSAPRVRGMDLSEWRRHTLNGSAPRVRGMVAIRPYSIYAGRFSPARAGNGSARSPKTRTWTVQPRACGEWSVQNFYKAGHAGSAPRVRGMVPQVVEQIEVERFSPARAGNGDAWPPEKQDRSVQPRACGEWLGIMCAV